MFSLVDSGKTGFVIDRKRLQTLRMQYAKKYPDFLEKGPSKSYVSNSIVGKLYRNACKYLDGKADELDVLFSQLMIDQKPSVR